jgi:hypothetical protein
MLWKEMPEYFPSNGQTVWVRLRYWYTKPFLATFSAANQTFTTSNGYVLPWYEAVRWRTQ